jgi:hypothetical protein
MPVAKVKLTRILLALDTGKQIILPLGKESLVPKIQSGHFGENFFPLSGF